MGVPNPPLAAVTPAKATADADVSVIDRNPPQGDLVEDPSAGSDDLHCAKKMRSEEPPQIVTFIDLPVSTRFRETPFTKMTKCEKQQVAHLIEHLSWLTVDFDYGLNSWDELLSPGMIGLTKVTARNMRCFAEWSVRRIIHMFEIKCGLKRDHDDQKIRRDLKAVALQAVEYEDVPNALDELCANLCDIIVAYGVELDAMDLWLCGLICDECFVANPSCPTWARLHMKFNDIIKKVEGLFTMFDFIREITDTATDIRRNAEYNDTMGFQVAYNTQDQQSNKMHPGTEPVTKQSAKAPRPVIDNNNKKSGTKTQKPKGSAMKCFGCGRSNHTQDTCGLRQHPDWNSQKSDWDQSTAGIAWKARIPSRETLPWNEQLSGKAFPKIILHDNGKDEYLYISDSLTEKELGDTKFYSAELSNDITCTKCISVKYLLDTGALNANYICRKLAEELQEEGVSYTLQDVRVKGLVDILVSPGFLYLYVIIEGIIIYLKFNILDIDYDMIIGRPTIHKHTIVARRWFMELYKFSNPLLCNELHLEWVQSTKRMNKDQLLSHQVEDESDFPDNPELEDGYIDLFERLNVDTEKGEIPFISDELSKDGREKVLALYHNYKEVFSSKLSETPAHVPPLHLEVNIAQWHVSENCAKPRVYSEVNHAEIRKQCEAFEAAGIIERSEAEYYSQVLLVKKKGSTDKRFCVDNRGVNKCTTSCKWPLPNIKQMLTRIGAHKPKWFGILDLTKGFYQVELDEESRIHTAFLTQSGLYQWKRIPMGLKNAPAHFQQVISQAISSLMYHTCELYIDDIILFAATEEEFIDRLERLLYKLKEKGITLNPAKCRLGLRSVEYVGHTLSLDGMTFSDEKRYGVYSTQRPETDKQLRSFLGLTNYFRDNVKDYGRIAQCLHNVLSETPKRGKVNWTEETDKAFLDLKEAVLRCQNLYFMKNEYEIVLESDASDYGIGAYLYQRIPVDNSDGKLFEQRPIQFISKGLQGSQLNWSTIDKEAYAIFYSLKKLSYLLRDVKFTIKTDHQNLLYLNLDNARVTRWKIEIQDFDFVIEHIEGSLNTVADSLSRMMNFSSESPLATDDLNSDEVPMVEHQLCLTRATNS